MKDIEERKKGRYVKEHIKTIDSIEYKMIETTVVGRDFEIMNYSREYKPGIKYPTKWEDI